MTGHDLCRTTMSGLRFDAKEAGVKVGRTLSTEGGGEYFYVYSRGHLVWEGGACCKWEARASYIDELLTAKLSNSCGTLSA